MFTAATVPAKPLVPRLLLSVTLVLLGLLLPSAARAQVTYAGTAATQNFDSEAIGSTSAAKTFSFSIAAGTTVGSIAVVTQGAPNLDFTSATGGACTAQTYASTTTCTVNVTFNPTFAGVRKGAVVFYSAANNTGNQPGSVPTYGVGTGPQIAYSPGTVVNILSELGDASLLPNGTAEDGAGDLFISDLNGNGVVEVPAGSHTWTEFYPAVNGIPLNYPAGLAVDGAGNLFIASQGDASVLEVPAGGGAAIAIEPVVNGTGLYEPAGVAVDVIGDLFIGDFGNNRVVEVPAGNGAPILINPTVAGKTLNLAAGLAVDEAGDLFIADDGNNRVVEIPAGGGAATAIDPTVGGVGLSSPTQLVLDGAGDLFIADHGNNRIVEVPAGGGAASATQLAGQGQLNWVSMDDAGDQFISASPFLQQADLVEVLRSQPPTLNFPTTYVGSTDTHGAKQTVQVQNTGNESLTFSALAYPVDFPEAIGDTNSCTMSTSLSTAQQCDLPIMFAPQNPGPLSEDVTLTTNAQNATGPQLIAVSGTATPAPVAITSPAPGSTLGVSNIAFTWTGGSGISYYDLWLGIAGPGSSDLYSSGITTATSVVVPLLPVKGATIYARLFYVIGGAVSYIDYTYTEPTAVLATLTSPTPGTTLGASNVTFTWNTGYGITNYNLWLGLSGPGSSSLYVSGITTNTSVTVPKIPAKGQTVYVRLFSNAEGEWESRDYTYTEP